MESDLQNLKKNNMNDSISNQNNINIIKQNFIINAEINLTLRSVQKIQKNNMKHNINDQNDIKCSI